MKKGDNRVLTRLDQAMMFENNIFHFTIKSNLAPFISIIPQTTLFNHVPITFSMESSNAKPIKFHA